MSRNIKTPRLNRSDAGVGASLFSTSGAMASGVPCGPPKLGLGAFPRLDPGSIEA
jgi:hypothetical protein